MRHLAAYLLASLSDESTSPSAEKIKAILGSVGIEADEKQMQIVLDKFKGKNPQALIKEGSSLLATLPSPTTKGPSVVSGGSTQTTVAPTKGEAKVEEKKEEPEEESDEDMGFGLFD